MPKDVNHNFIGWIQESFTQLRNTDGMYRCDPGSEYVARITVKNPDAPELPNLDFVSCIDWMYSTTEYHRDQGERVIYEFIVKDFDDDKLRQVVFFFDTLYGF